MVGFNDEVILNTKAVVTGGVANPPPSSLAGVAYTTGPTSTTTMTSKTPPLKLLNFTPPLQDDVKSSMASVNFARVLQRPSQFRL